MPLLTLPIDDVWVETPRTRGVRIRLSGREFVYRPGQAVWVGLHGGSQRKPYSIACSPAQAAELDALELLVQVGADGSAGSHLGVPAPELLVDLDGPIGRFSFPAQPLETRFLFVAGGTGIAPLRAMLWHALARFPDSEIALFYSARAADEFAYGREMRELAQSGRVVLRETVTRENASVWTGARGRFTQREIAETVEGRPTLCFVCGPPALVRDVTGWLRQIGVPETRILAEGSP